MSLQHVEKVAADRGRIQLYEFERLLKYVLIVLAGVSLGFFLFLAIVRSPYGYDLEWMEGGMVDNVIRILDGGQLYVKPSLDFIPFTYTPLYLYVSAAFTAVLGEGYLPLRLVSILSTLGIFLLIFQMVRRETDQWFYGLLSAGMFAAAFKYTGSWYDLARTDSLFMVLLLAGVYLLRFREQPRYLVLAGFLFWLSFMTKQTALIIAVTMSVYCLVYLPGWRRVIFPATVGFLVGLSSLVINKLSDGWYYYYIYHLPQEKGAIPGKVAGFWLTDMRQVYLGLAISLTFLLFLMVLSRRKDFAFYALMFTGLVGASWLISNYYGSYVNDRIPALAAISVLFGLGAYAMTSFDRGGVLEKAPPGEERRSFSQLLLVNFVLLACVLQLLVLVYNPLDQLPSDEDTRAGDALVTLLEQVDGEVFVPGSGYIARQAGKKSSAHVVAFGDVLNARDQQAEALEQEYLDAVDDRRYDLIVLDSDFGHDWVVWKEAMDASLEDTTLIGKVYFSKDSFFPVTGHQGRPDTLFIFTSDWDWNSVYAALGFVGNKPPDAAVD